MQLLFYSKYTFQCSKSTAFSILWKIVLLIINHVKSCNYSIIWGKIWCKSPSANRLGDQAMIAIRSVGETCPAHKSVPDIETNVRPILSDIAALAWLMVRDIQYLQKFAAAAAATVNPAVLAARRQHSLLLDYLTRLIRYPPSISFLNRRTLPFLLIPYFGRNVWLGFTNRQKLILENSVSSPIAFLSRLGKEYYDEQAPGNDWPYLVFRIVPCHFIDIVWVCS